MKIKIDKFGYLNIERAGVVKTQGCPYTNNGDSCGDWCPLFGGPRRVERVLEKLSAPGIEISLCKKTLICTLNDFTDERQS